MERDASAGGPIVAGFADNGFRIGEAVFPALLMTIADVLPWSPPPLPSLTAETLQWLTVARPEFILLGTGADLARPPSSLVAALDRLTIGVEAMDSRAAARAWGVLRGEGRIVAAALYPLDA